MSKQVTIKDVALDAHVSITTASFALNNIKGRVSQKTRERVLESARKLKYTVNNNARSLRTSNSKTVMFAFSGEYLEERYLSHMASLTRCIEFADLVGYGILLELVDSRCTLDELVQKFMRIWESGRVDGIIFQCFFEDHRDDELYRRLYKSGVNLVNISRIGDASDYPCVYLEEFQMVRDQVRYAVQKKYDKLYYVCRRHLTYGIRERGFLDEIAGEKVRGQILNYQTHDCGEEELWKTVGPVMNDGKNERRAFICWNDTDAMTLISVLKNHGVSVPGDVGVMGFDNIPLTEYVTPRLTTVSHPFSMMAGKAFDMLIKIIRGEELTRAETHIAVDSEIIERDSM